MMRPKLRADTFYIPVAHGVAFQNQHGSFEIRGQTTYHWIERLAPYLNGHYTLAEILQGLDPQRQAWVSSFLEILQVHHCLKDASQDHPHTLTKLEEETYASAIAYIDAFQDSATHRFERFRECQTLVIGSGLTHMNLVHAMLQRGVRQLAILTTQECVTDRQRYQEYRDLRHESDPQQTLMEIADLDWKDELTILSAIEPFDIILYVSDLPMLERAKCLNRLCAAQKKLLVQAVIIDTCAWIGPLMPKDQKGCWECAWLRLQSRLSGEQAFYTFQNHATSPVSYMVALPTAALIANLLSFELFKYCTEAGPQEIVRNMISIDLALPHIQKHPFLPHPLCSTCSSLAKPTKTALLERFQHLERQEALDEDYFPRRVAPCFEERLGLFSSLDPRGYGQMPLSVCRASMSRLPGLADTERPLLLAGVGRNFYQARRRLMQRALEVYAANMVISRRLIPTEKMQGEENIMHANRFLGGEDLTEVRDWVWALQMHTELAYLVPAPLVFPVLRSHMLWKEIEPGVASGMSWVEAICRALLNWCKQLTIAELDTRKEPCPQVDIDALLPYMKHNLRLYLLNAAKDGLMIYDVTGVLQVPTFAFCVKGKTIAYSIHPHPLQAIHQGIEQTVQQLQAVSEAQPEYALAAVPDVPVTLRGDTAAVPHDTCPQEWPDLQQWLQERLSKLGWQAFVVPLDHDSALTDIFPYVVHVLLGKI